MGSSPIRVAIPYASVAQLVEQGTENPRVVGSIPTGGTIYADLAHLVERHLAKVEVAGSSPVIRSSERSRPKGLLFTFPGRITGQCSGNPSHFALKTLLEHFLYKRSNPLLLTAKTPKRQL